MGSIFLRRALRDPCEVLKPAGLRLGLSFSIIPLQMDLTPDGGERLSIILSPVHCSAARGPVLAEQASPVWELITKQQVCSLVPQTNFSRLTISRNYAKTRGCRNHGFYQRESTKIIQHLL